MALHALRALLSGVFVVLLVAAHALHRQLLTESRVDMARLALNRRMFAAQRVLGIFIVVELGFFPFGFKMACIAGRAKFAFVDVFPGMAPIAVLGRFIDMEFSGVTGVAFYFRVRLAQTKSGIALVFELDLLP